MPWNYQGWHAGGNANNELIGFEICEPKDYTDKNEFMLLKNKALELCVYLCEKFKLNETHITSHVEGYRNKGKLYASNHSDLDHWWFKYHNYSMNDFRNELKDRLMKGNTKMEFRSGKEALEYLVAKERITESDYWNKALETTKNIDHLLIKWAKDVALLSNNTNIKNIEE